ncbi:hypothetical protein MTR_6g066080 [Medicago truncatula]|uniref:Uncharacterized protein n=1 Tax=Medicago truncatula TaxID=3880 RepID=A0A072UB38_MEDTR|nr:hypothetical protein MTR_6g066080 [Medicago truncatula]
MEVTKLGMWATLDAGLQIVMLPILNPLVGEKVILFSALLASILLDKLKEEREKTTREYARF